MMWRTHGVFFSSGMLSPEELEVLKLMRHEYYTFNTPFISTVRCPSFVQPCLSVYAIHQDYAITPDYPVVRPDTRTGAKVRMSQTSIVGKVLWYSISF